jgi:hypothetical protein
MLDGLWLSVILILAALGAGLLMACARLPGAPR